MAATDPAPKPAPDASPSDILMQAWKEYNEYSQNANKHKKMFDRRQTLILVLGVVAVLLALTQTQVIGTDPPIPHALLESTELAVLDAEAALSSLSGAARDSSEAAISRQKEDIRQTRLYKWLQYGIIIVPIFISMLVAVSNKLKAGSKWILLRSAAESIKRETYLYRAAAGLYNPSSLKDSKTRENQLADQLKAITDRLMKTVANEAGIKRYKITGDGSDASYREKESQDITTASQYITERLDKQLDYYTEKTDQLGTRMKALQWFIYTSGGLGTFLAAVGLEIWVALTTALGTAFVTFLEYRQVENTLLLYNQVSGELRNVKNWWLALTPEERETAQNKNLLVQQCEDILMNEQSGWAKNMTDALAQLQAKQEKAQDEALDHKALITKVKQFKEEADEKKKAATEMLEEMKTLLEKGED